MAEPSYKLTAERLVAFLDKLSKFTRVESSIIVRPRKAKIGLRNYLNKIGADESGNCPCGELLRCGDKRNWIESR